jgi:diguanylate cyclase (GGDEF)-like protein
MRLYSRFLWRHGHPRQHWSILMSRIGTLDGRETSATTTRRLPAMADMKVELALLVMLLLTTYALVFGDVLLSRTISFSPAPPRSYDVAWHNDESEGGDSTVTSTPRDRLAWSCQLKPRYAYPYCGYDIRFDGARQRSGIDLTKFDRMTVDLEYSGPAKTVRFFVDNSDARYRPYGIPNFIKYNRAETKIVNGRQSIQIMFHDLGVPDWWIDKYGIPPELSRPQFDNVTALEIVTGTGAPPGTYHFRIRKVELHGSLLNGTEKYGSLLAIWLGAVMAFLVYRLRNLKADLHSRRMLQILTKREADSVKREAQTDYLTRVLNRFGLTDGYVALVADHARPGPVALLMVDVDHFKAINDRFGHNAGDVVLTLLAQRLVEHARAGDLMGRWGGEEFILVLRDCSQRVAMDVGEALRKSIAELDLGPFGQVTVSVGAVSADPAPPDLATLVEQADVAMYRAKKQGRNRVLGAVTLHA